MTIDQATSFAGTASREGARRAWRCCPSTVQGAASRGAGVLGGAGLLAVMVNIIALGGCGGDSAASLERFQEHWHAAVNQRKPEQLYDMLDARSRRLIDVKLETLRGLPESDQLAVINYLGGDRVANLHELSNDRYFALWWRKATDDELPTMTIEAIGDRSAYMVVTRGDKSQRYELKIEGGRWVWALPEQNLELPVWGSDENPERRPDEDAPQK